MLPLAPFGRGVSTGKALVMNDNAPEVNYKTSWLKNVASFMVSSDNFFVTYSRRKAIRKAKELNRMMKVV